MTPQHTTTPVGRGFRRAIVAIIFASLGVHIAAQTPQGQTLSSRQNAGAALASDQILITRGGVSYRMTVAELLQPIITSQPLDAAILPGATLSFSMVAGRAAPPVQLQWSDATNAAPALADARYQLLNYIATNAQSLIGH
jgi:hypothetical protein